MKKKNKIHRFESTVTKVETLTPTVRNLHLSVPDDFIFEPGQFVSLTVSCDGKDVKRPYSIASSPKKGIIELCIKKVEGGPCSTRLHKIKVGEKVKILGPAGHFTLNEKKDKDIVFISTGTGIAPFRSMIHDILKSGHKKNVKLLTGYRYEDESLYKEELSELEKKHQNFSHHASITRPSENYQGQKGRVQELIKTHIKDTNQTFLLCGLNAMIQDVKSLLLTLEIPEDNIHFERWD
jgi:ferredoxin-NADP reductase